MKYQFRHLTGLLMALVMFVAANHPVHADNAELFSTYQQIKTRLDQNVYGLPIHIQSVDSAKRPRGEVYGIIRFPFATVKAAMTVPDNWCDIVSLHLNIKACTYRPQNDQCRLTFYSGRKYYEAPEDAYRLDYHYQVTATTRDYFQVELAARDGPLNTSDYLIVAEAIPLDDSSTFIHFSYAYRQGFLARLATKAYLATLGHDKIGFTVIARDDNGNPIFIHGTRGILERNAVRYFFAVQAYLETLKDPESIRFRKRIVRWFDLTERYSAQLHELDKKEYISNKIREYQNQIRLQNAISANGIECRR